MWKIAALCCALATAAVALLTVFSVYLPWRDKMRRQQSAVRDLIDATAPQLIHVEPGGRLGVDGYQLEALISASRAAQRGYFQAEILYAIVLQGGKIDVGSSRLSPWLVTALSPPARAGYDKDPAGFLAALRSEQRPGLRALRVHLRSSEGSDTALDLDVGVSTRAIDAELRNGLVRDAGVLGATLVLAVLGAIFIGGRIARPLGQLSSAMSRLEQGDFDVRSAAERRRDEIGDLARAFNAMAVGLKERERLRGSFSRYVSGDVAERILAENDDLSLPGELRRVTVLFLDVRGFTSVSERMAPAEVVALLNDYFDVVVDRVTAHGGMVNKFIGDAAMCIWGAPRAVTDPERSAVACALEIQRDCAELSKRRAARGLMTVGLGIGINAGEVVAGNLGAARRLEYTVIGDAVNLAQRLESQARPGDTIVSESIYRAVEGDVHAAPREPVKLKGKSQPVPLWEIHGMRADTEAA